MDDEALQLTQQLLSSNPDFATLWNYRREILMHMETVKSDHNQIDVQHRPADDVRYDRRGSVSSSLLQG